MKFDLIRPCKDCPFRSDIEFHLRVDRVREILDAITRQQQTFTCHKTNAFSEDDDGNGDTVESKDSQHCAGALILLERMRRPNQMMRWMERLGGYDRTKLDMGSPVFNSAAAMIKHFDALERIEHPARRVKSGRSTSTLGSTRATTHRTPGPPGQKRESVRHGRGARQLRPSNTRPAGSKAGAQDDD